MLSNNGSNGMVGSSLPLKLVSMEATLASHTTQLLALQDPKLNSGGWTTLSEKVVNFLSGYSNVSYTFDFDRSLLAEFSEVRYSVVSGYASININAANTRFVSVYIGRVANNCLTYLKEEGTALQQKVYTLFDGSSDYPYPSFILPIVVYPFQGYGLYDPLPAIKSSGFDGMAINQDPLTFQINSAIGTANGAAYGDSYGLIDVQATIRLEAR